MAKKVAKTSKKTTKKPAAKKVAAKPASSKKTTSKKATSKKTTSKKTASKKAASKKTASKKTSSSGSAAKPTSKSAPKTPAATGSASKKVASKQSSVKKTSKAAAAKKTTSKAATSKSPAAKKTSSKKTSVAAPAGKSATKSSGGSSSKAGASKADASKASAADDKKAGRKGITFAANKPTRKSKPKVEIPVFVPPGGPLLGPGAKRRAPLIASGPKNKVAVADGEAVQSEGAAKKSPFNKRKLQHYKDVLLMKRRALVDQLNNLEHQALKSESGSLSNLPQHSAEQGSDTTEQSLSLGMADADRQLIREIDAAVIRIEEGTFGLCTQTGVPISEDRLEELPWARLSIDAARANERGYGP